MALRYQVSSLAAAVEFSIAYILTGALVLLLPLTSSSADYRSAHPRHVKSSIGSLGVAAHLRIGEPAILLGSGDISSPTLVKTNYIMAQILSRITTKNVRQASQGQCNAVIWPSNHNVLRTFVYKSASAGSLDLTRNCMFLLKNSLRYVDFADDELYQVISDVVRSHVSLPSRVRGAPPPLVVAAELRAAIKNIYTRDSIAYTLLSIGVQELVSVKVPTFKRWLQDLRDSNAIRLLTDDPQLQPYLGVMEGEWSDWRPISTTKRQTYLIKLDIVTNPIVRAAVLIFVPPPVEGKIRNDATLKYCSNEPSFEVSYPYNRTRCWFENYFDQDAWIAFYLVSADGPDSAIRERIQRVAMDPVVLKIAAQEKRSGRPYVVFFSD